MGLFSPNSRNKKKDHTKQICYTLILIFLKIFSQKEAVFIFQKTKP